MYLHTYLLRSLLVIPSIHLSMLLCVHWILRNILEFSIHVSHSYVTTGSMHYWKPCSFFQKRSTLVSFFAISSSLYPVMFTNCLFHRFRYICHSGHASYPCISLTISHVDTFSTTNTLTNLHRRFSNKPRREENSHNPLERKYISMYRAHRAKSHKS
jgi:phosphatidylglycerophosphate synthase